MNISTFPTIFVSHGGGPWPFVEGMKDQYEKTTAEFKSIPQHLPEKPLAILVISGHWISPTFTVSTAIHPPMEYDYTGFPEHTYHIKYPAPGSPTLAARVRKLLYDSGIQSNDDSTRGFDHGTFVPLSLMFPKADVPVVMLSLKLGFDPAEHLHAGRALFLLRQEGVLIIGSGLTYHNMRGFGRRESASVADMFESYLNRAITQVDPNQRNEMLLNWEKGPGSRLAHPQEDHLVPLMVVAGAAGKDIGHRLFLDHVMGVSMASYQFG